MRSLSEVALSFLALLEAEGKLMRAKAIDAGGAIVAIFIGGLFFFVACIVGAIAAHMFLSDIYGDVIAALVVAGGFAIIALVLMLYGFSKR